LALFDGDVPSDCGIWLGKDVARLKSSADLVKAIESAVRFYEEPPTNGMRVDRCVAMTRATQRLVILTSA
jgi:hypothetical protein